jgi:hypothetical protein
VGPGREFFGSAHIFERRVKEMIGETLEDPPVTAEGSDGAAGLYRRQKRRNLGFPELTWEKKSKK